MNYDKVKDEFGDWAVKLRPFIESSDFDDIYKFLKEEGRQGKIICPDYKDTFRAFRATPYSKLRCIFILQDPYPWVKNGKYIADGVAMSCRNTGVCQPSLDMFYDGIEDDLGVDVPHQPDLDYLCEQGVLFLNTNLTVELNKPTSHNGVWNKFIDFVIQESINFYNSGLIYVAFGKTAHVTAKAIVPFLHWGFEVEHPAAAARQERAWKHDNIFTKINKILKNNNNEQINWVYDEYTKDPGTGIKGAKRIK
jgi:uracil-DNA glycosylase